MSSTRADVLILTGSTGRGHLSVSQSVATDLLREGVTRVAVVDVFDLKTPLFGRLGDIYLAVTRDFLSAYDRLWELTNRVSLMQISSVLTYPVMRGPMVRLMRRVRPKVVVVTHPLFIPTWAFRAAREANLEARLIVLVSDLVRPHASWAAESNATILVTTSFAAAAIHALKRDGRELIRVAFPVDQRLRSLPTQIEARQTAGLDISRPTILITGGGNGSGPIEEAALALDRNSLDLQLVLAPGRHSALRGKLAKMMWSNPVRVLEEATDIVPFYAACDLVVGKAGPSTVFEANAAGKPLLAIAEVGRQEHGNGAYLEEMGAGIWCQTIADMVRHAKRLLVGPKPGSGTRDMGPVSAAAVVARAVDG